MVVQCCVCQRVRHENEWVAPTKAVAESRESVSHGYCPRCAAEAFAEIRRLHAGKRRNRRLLAL